MASTRISDIRGPQGLPSTVPGPQGAPGVNAIPADEYIADRIATPGTATEGALAAKIATALKMSLADAMAFVTAFIYGHSWTNAVAGPDQGSWFFSRVCAILRTLAPTNQGNQGFWMHQIADRIRTTHTPNKRGVRFIVGTVNDANNLVATSTTAEAFRTALAYLTARYVGTGTTTDFTYGAGWSGGTTTTVDAFTDLTFTVEAGQTPHLQVQGASSTGAQCTVQNAAGEAVTYNLGGYGNSVNLIRSIPLIGFSAGTHTARIVNKSAVALTIVGVTIPAANPPTIVWLKEPPLTGFDSSRNTRLAAMHTANAAVAALFPSVVPVAVPVGEDGWDGATMLYADGIHPNDLGNSFLASVIIETLKALPYREGQNTVAVQTPPAYTPPPGPPATVYASDNFNRTESGPGVAVTGQAWTTSGNAQLDTNGSRLVVTAVATSGDNLCTVDTGQSSGTVRVKVSASVNAGLVFRKKSDGSAWVFYRNSGTTGSLRKRSAAGAYSDVAVNVTIGAAVDGQEPRAVLNGNNVAVYHGATLIWSGVDAFNNDATQQGVYGAANGITFEDFLHDSALA